MPNSDDAFKEVFKYFKSKCPPPDINDAVDFRNLDQNKEGIQFSSIKITIQEDLLNLLGLENISTWKVFTMDRNPGLVYIRNPFTSIGQRYWMKRCLSDYPKYPHKTNLDIYEELNVENWWKFCHTNQDGHNLLKTLRWTTLGYHHDWNTKVYSDQNRHPFPEDLGKLCNVIASCLDHEDFKPQAAIVNYYHMDSTLSAHTDHSEVNLEAPLISISFGQSAIFLLGGRTRDVKPTALHLHSGDIVVMSKESRLCYHAVPKILPCQDEPWNHDIQHLAREKCDDDHERKCRKLNDDEVVKECMKICRDETFWAPFDSYVKESRINLNVRQVLLKNQHSLNR